MSPTEDNPDLKNIFVNCSK